MTSVAPLPDDHDFSGEAAGASDKVQAGNLDAQVTEIKAKIGEMITKLGVTIDDDDTLTESIVRLHNLHPEVLSILFGEDLEGIRYLVPADVVSVANIDVLSPPGAFDGVNVGGAFKRVLLTAQTDPVENGVWVYTTLQGPPFFTFVRATDWDDAGDALSDTQYRVQVRYGTLYGGSFWVLDENDPVPGTSAQTWQQYQAAQPAPTELYLGAPNPDHAGRLRGEPTAGQERVILGMGNAVGFAPGSGEEAPNLVLHDVAHPSWSGWAALTGKVISLEPRAGGVGSRLRVRGDGSGVSPANEIHLETSVNRLRYGTGSDRLVTKSSGTYLHAPNAAPADGELANSQVTFWHDNGASWLGAKLKTSSGVVKSFRLERAMVDRHNLNATTTLTTATHAWSTILCSDGPADYGIALPNAPGADPYEIGLAVSASNTRWVTISGNGNLIGVLSAMTLRAAEHIRLRWEPLLNQWLLVGDARLPCICRARAAGIVTAVDATWTEINLDNFVVLEDSTDGLASPMYDAALYHIRIPRDGRYRLTASGSVDFGGGSGGAQVAVSAVAPSALLPYTPGRLGYFDSRGAEGNRAAGCVSFSEYLVTGTAFKIAIRQVSGANRNCGGTINDRYGNELIVEELL